MDRLPAHFRTTTDTPGCAQPDGGRSGPQMLDGSDGPARLVFESPAGGQHVAWLDHWLVIIRFQPPARGASRMLWLLDTSTLHWPGAQPPAPLRDRVARPQAGKAPVLWFRSGESADRRRSFTASGVFGAAGIVDAARVRVHAPRLRRRVRLQMSIESAMWGLSGEPAWPDDAAWAGGLAITASGALRPLEPQAVRPWQ